MGTDLNSRAHFRQTAALPLIFTLLATGVTVLPTARTAFAEGDGAATFQENVVDALSAPTRTPDEIARDKNRKPVETLAFAGLTVGMDVLELVPGGGWYTKLLLPALGDDGSVSVWVGIERFADRIQQPGLEEVKVVAADVSLQSTDRRGIFDLPDSASKIFGKNDYDAVLTFRNLHNLTPRARAVLNRAVFRALRPGGLYLVVDHTRRHMQADDAENRRRLDPVLAVQEALAAGFEFEAFSDLHYRPDDELRYEVGRHSVTGNTDRFTLLFRKPQ